MLGNVTNPKYANPGSPVTQVNIGTIAISNTLVDLENSIDLDTVINVMTNQTKLNLSLDGL